jgi:peptidoglycan/xylan/chitin deacetylase (PgdA/CDA1 family)
LEKKNIKVTFFISGRWASNNPELLKLIYQKGHEIGNHGYSHKMHSKITEHENYAEIKKTEDAIQEILGIKPKFFAPPAGDCNNITINVARKLGYKTILWNIDTIDWKEGSTAQIIINRVMKKPHGGAILLMHPKEATVEALPDLIDKIEKEGIKIGTVSDLLQ